MHAVAAVIVVMVGYIGPLRHYRGRYGQPGGVIVLVPLTDTFDSCGNENADDQKKHQEKQKLKNFKPHPETHIHTSIS
jgi:hypothetical protein